MAKTRRRTHVISNALDPFVFVSEILDLILEYAKTEYNYMIRAGGIDQLSYKGWHRINDANWWSNLRQAAIVSYKCYIYQIGGTDRFNLPPCHSTVLKYDTTKRKLIEIASCKYNRMEAKAVVVDHQLYLIGGSEAWYRPYPECNKFECNLPLEVLDLKKEIWSERLIEDKEVADFVNHFATLAFVCEGNIWFVQRDGSGTLKYSPGQNQWQWMAKRLVGFNQEFITVLIVDQHLIVLSRRKSASVNAVQWYQMQQDQWSWLKYSPPSLEYDDWYNSSKNVWIRVATQDKKTYKTTRWSVHIDAEKCALTLYPLPISDDLAKTQEINSSATHEYLQSWYDSPRLVTVAF